MTPALLTLDWLLQTSVMPLCVGAATGWLAPWVLRCGGRATARAASGAAAAWLAHIALVGSALVREGSNWDYAAVLAATVAVLLWRCTPSGASRQA